MPGNPALGAVHKAATIRVFPLVGVGVDRVCDLPGKRHDLFAFRACLDRAEIRAGSGVTFCRIPATGTAGVWRIKLAVAGENFP